MTPMDETAREKIELACEGIDWIAAHQPPAVRADLERLTGDILAALRALAQKDQDNG